MIRPEQHQIRELCTEQSFQRGMRYFEEGRVKITGASPSSIVATVIGTDKYHVEIDLDAFSASCNCPYDLEGYCKHIVATFLAIENIEAYIAYPKAELPGDYKDYFFLRGIGDSMNDSDIRGKPIDDGDYVLVRKQSSADRGDRVVALIGDDVTIKRFMPDKEGIKLAPESTNTANKTIIVFDEVLIQGKAVDVVKPEGGKNG